MGLHETLKQVPRTHKAMIASADRAEEAATRMEQTEQRFASLVDQRVASLVSPT